MGRKHAAGNEDFGRYVSRRSSGILEVRFPIPEEVRHAFPDAKGRPRTAIIKSLGTTDIKLANAKAEAIKTQLRADIRRASEARGSNDLSDYLQWLFDYDLSSFTAEEADRARTSSSLEWGRGQGGGGGERRSTRHRMRSTRRGSTESL